VTQVLCRKSQSGKTERSIEVLLKLEKGELSVADAVKEIERGK